MAAEFGRLRYQSESKDLKAKPLQCNASAESRPRQYTQTGISADLEPVSIVERMNTSQVSTSA